MIADKLLPHQHEPARRLIESLRANGCALDSSDTGVGKTYVAAAVIAEMRLPTLVVHPKSLYSSWRVALAHMGTEADQINYEKLRTGSSLYGHWVRRTHAGEWEQCNPKAGGAKFRFHEAVGLLVFDEGHRCKGHGTQNARLLKAAKEQKIPTLVLTATPAQSPTEMDALGQLLGLHAPYKPVTMRTLAEAEDGLPTFHQWCIRQGCRPGIFGGLEFRGTIEQRNARMNRIRHEIGTKMVRVRTTDVAGFPENLILPELLDIQDPERVTRLYAEMQQAVQELHTRKLEDKDPNHPLTKILRARQEIELLKVPSVVERISDLVAEGKHVAVFVNFSQTAEALAHRLQHLSLAFINGQQTAEERDNQVAKFQRDDAEVIICQIDSGGVGISLHDLHGEFPRVGIIFPGFSATALRQALGRLPRAGAKSNVVQYIVFAAHSCEERVHRNVKQRLDNLDSLIDHDLLPDNIPLKFEKPE